MPKMSPATMQAPTVLLTEKEVMHVLKCGRGSLRILRQRKQDPLPSVKLEKMRRYPLDRVLYWIENQPS